MTRWRNFCRLLPADVVVAIFLVGSQLLLFEIRSMCVDELALIYARRLSVWCVYLIPKQMERIY